MKKVMGLLLVLALSIGGGVLYVKSNTFQAQDLPDSYKILDDLENKGLYQNEDLVMKTLKGEQVSMASLKGKIVVLSFWATWCEPCVEEFPSLIKLLDEFPDKVVLVAISHDESEQDVKEFVGAFKGFRDNMILTMDENKKLSKAFGVDRLPEGFIFDDQGLLKKKIIGIQDWATPSAIAFFKMLAGREN